MRVSFQQGTLEVFANEDEAFVISDLIRFDERTKTYRAQASDYADIVRGAVRAGKKIEDSAKKFIARNFEFVDAMQPRDYQSEAVATWSAARGRGVVVLPTGSGKSFVAGLAIKKTQRDSLIIAPTLDLVRQWQENLGKWFGVEVGAIGGGTHEVREITVSTYDSAAIHMDRLGAQFGLIIYDECHHLPSEVYSFAARSAIAPYRLGLTATPERADGLDDSFDELIGDIVFRRDIVDMSGSFLSDYETREIEVTLSDEERVEYQHNRDIYLSYIRKKRIRFGSQQAWAQFVMRASSSAEGRSVLRAHRRQKEIATATPAKLEHVEELLFKHRQDRAIVFTQDNATAYEIARRFLIPVITHETRLPERKWILEALNAGDVHAVVTSKVLNEGVDVPSANVAIIVSGSGSVREHVQRLGRILRKQEGKNAVLYELVTRGTTEMHTAQRRKEHDAYQR